MSPSPAGCSAACQDADRAKVERLLAADPGLPGRIPAAQQAAAMIHAAESGNTAAITLLLDLGFPVDARGDDRGTPLHAAAYFGSAPAVRLLLDRGAGVEARDTTWDSTPMEWAAVGSGEQPARRHQSSLGYEQYDACFRHPGQSFADAVTRRTALPRICR
jgi:hypothetical protein